MANDGVIGFFRRNGKVIPVRASSGGGNSNRMHDGGNHPGSHIATKINKAKDKLKEASEQAKVHANTGLQKVGVDARFHVEPIKANKKLDALGLGLSVASGVVSAATFSHGTKGFLSGVLGSHVLDAAGIGANVAAVAGKGRTKERAQLAAKNEFRNFVVGNAVFGAGLVMSKKNRGAIKSLVSVVSAMGKKAMRMS